MLLSGALDGRTTEDPSVPQLWRWGALGRLWLGALAAATLGCRGSTHAAVIGHIEIDDAFVLEPIAPEVTSAYFTIRNTGDSSDAVVGATTPVAGMAMLHGSESHGARRAMTHIARLALPARGTVSLAPGGMHLMLSEVKRKLEPGDTVPIALRLERAGSVTVPFVVRTYQSVNR